MPNGHGYTRCIIRFVGDDRPFCGIIKEDENVIEEEDCKIFFYGIPYYDLYEGASKGTVFEGEWLVERVLDYYT